MKLIKVKKTKSGFGLDVTIKSVVSTDGVRLLKLLDGGIEYDKLMVAFKKEFVEFPEDDYPQEFINILHELRYSYLMEERYGQGDKIRLTELGKNVLNIVTKKKK